MRLVDIMKPLDEDLNAGPDPYLLLTLAVIRKALSDCVVKRTKTANQDRETNEVIAGEARDFLLRRLWLDGNMFGEVLRSYGIHGMTRAQLSRSVRIGEMG